MQWTSEASGLKELLLNKTEKRRATVSFKFKIENGKWKMENYWEQSSDYIRFGQRNSRLDTAKKTHL